ncbi:MAG TPA: hypothetical protein VF820_03830 [Patescibacteria group bacterium]
MWIFLKNELLTLRSLVSVICIALLYILLSGILLNTKLISNIFAADFALIYKVKFLYFLLTQFWQTLVPFDQILLFLNALLTGLNILLIFKTISSLKHKGKVRLSVGGATIVTLITSGCASCGVSVISILGISSTLSFLPFHGMELHILATILLIVSLIYMMRQLYIGRYCKIPLHKSGNKKDKSRSQNS